jgi:adenylate cyclase
MGTIRASAPVSDGVDSMLLIAVSNKNESVRLEHLEGPLEFGRVQRDGYPRVVLHDNYVSSSHLRVEELEGGILQITNLSERNPVDLSDGTTFMSGEVREVTLPTEITIGESQIEIRVGEELPVDSNPLMTIARPLSGLRSKAPLSLDLISTVPSLEKLARWFESVINVQRAAASSSNFYDEIARAVVELIGLDFAMVMLRKGKEWDIVSSHAAPDAPPFTFSRTILDRVCLDRQTFYQTAGLSDTAQSLTGVATVVASPVLDSEGETVLGAVYGAKVLRDIYGGDELTSLHAQLVQVLAAAAAAGIARMRSETEAARRHVQFEQFFSKELASELDRNPELLVGQDREVTVLVSDIRGFSRIAERLGPRETCLLMGDVLERLTEQIKEHGGVVVDYVGDGILAMWNAPILQPDHALRACRAAMAMIGQLSGLNERWSERIQTTLALGIGVNTGDALVGNTGSAQRLKYGPLGNTVNLASRVEGATKQLGVPVLITGATHSKLGESFATRRLCAVRVVGIEAPVVLFELHGETDQPRWASARDAYEIALSHYERGQFSEACRALFPLLDGADGHHDRPTLILAARALDGLQAPTQVFEPVFVLDTK